MLVFVEFACVHVIKVLNLVFFQEKTTKSVKETDFSKTQLTTLHTLALRLYMFLAFLSQSEEVGQGYVEMLKTPG